LLFFLSLHVIVFCIQLFGYPATSVFNKLSSNHKPGRIFDLRGMKETEIRSQCSEEFSTSSLQHTLLRGTFSAIPIEKETKLASARK